MSIISLSLKLVLEASSSLRGAAASMAIFVEQGLVSFPVPSFSTIRSWLLRVGHYALTRLLDRTTQWVWLIDHTVQIGSQKMLVILGCPMNEVPFGQRALQLSDLQLVALVPMEKSNGAAIETELENATRRTGAPRLIVSDQGSDLRKGIADFQRSHPQTHYVPDVAHYGANLLEHAWDDQPRWQQFIKELQNTSSKLRQTKSAYLLAPRMRPKARFMNVESQLRFTRCLLKHLDGATPHAKALEYYGWLKDYRDDLAIWDREHGMVQTTIELVRVQGLRANTESLLDQALGEIGSHESTAHIAKGLREYVVKYQPTVKEDRFVASTEILESSFGKLKRIERDQSQNGMTSLVLAMGAIVGRCNETEIKEALDATPQKKVDTWVRGTLGQSVQWFRKQFLGQNKA